MRVESVEEVDIDHNALTSCTVKWKKWIREGQLRKYLRINRREVEEEEDLD
jgi:hypothetical protein